MQQTNSPLVQIILRYDAPLQRYARRLVKDQAMAAAIVKTVFERVYALNQFNVSDTILRRLFKECTYGMAYNWLLHGQRESSRQPTDDRRQKEGRPQTTYDRQQKNQHKNNNA